jgi:hypothetical protein
MRTLTRFALPDPDTLSPLRAMYSLHEKHVAVLTAALTRLPETWSLERHEGYDGDLTLLLMPQHEETEKLFVNRSADGFHLIANHEDEFRELGCFDAMDDLVACMRKNIVTAMNYRTPAYRVH